MREEENSQEIGRQLGSEGVEHAVGNGERFAEYERQRIELTNRAPIIALRANIALLRERELELKDRLHHAPPPGDLRARRRKAIYYWAVSAALTLAGFFFSLLAFDPYRLGWKSYLYCIGIAIVTPFSVEKFLDIWAETKLVKTLSTAAFAAAISSLVLLAVIRGDVLSQQVKATTQVIVSGDDHPTATEPSSTFYDTTLVLLRVVMALLAVAMELGAGLALHDARRLGQGLGDDPEALAAELDEAHRLMVSGLSELTALENEPDVFIARFWRDFYRSMLTHTAKKALGKLLVIAVGAGVLLLPHSAEAADRLNLVVMVDLTQSVAVKAHDDTTESGKNLQAVTRLLAQVPAGAHVTVLAITGNSFAQPYILLSADVPADEGYFKEKLAGARRQFVSNWQKRIKHLQVCFSHTDILGALLLADQIFHEKSNGWRNVLVIFSDMRQETADLDLETPATFDAEAAIVKTEKKLLIAHLVTVEVYVLGVDNAGKPLAYWNRLREYWIEYFKKAGAHVESYSVLRQLPRIAP
ncbi:MAG: hypothetical protein ACLP1Y_13775 [Candidatus Acidiferrales bacterium]